MTDRASCLEDRGVKRPPPQDRSTPMSEKPISPLRRRMIEDMTVRNFVEKTRNDYIRHVRSFTAFLGRSPDTATPEDLRGFQVNQTQTGVHAPSINGAVAGGRPRTEVQGRAERRLRGGSAGLRGGGAEGIGYRF